MTLAAIREAILVLVATPAHNITSKDVREIIFIGMILAGTSKT
jgi:hypothetical protein